MNHQHSPPPGIEPGAIMYDLPYVGSLFLLPDPAAPDDRYAVCWFHSARRGSEWVTIEQADLFPIFNSTTWVQAERYLASRSNPA